MNESTRLKSCFKESIYFDFSKSISILTPGLVSRERFDMVVLPEHDKPKRTSRARLVIPKVSPNLINPAYLKEQSLGLVKYFSHLNDDKKLSIRKLISSWKIGEKKIREYSKNSSLKAIQKIRPDGTACALPKELEVYLAYWIRSLRKGT